MGHAPQGGKTLAPLSNALTDAGFTAGFLQARKYERDLDARLAAFAKLCSSSPGDFKRKGETGLAAEQACLSLIRIAFQDHSD